jgi:hypothetical protein
MSNMRFTIKYIQQKLQSNNMDIALTEPITLRKVNTLFAAVGHEFIKSPCDVQITIVRNIRKQQQQDRLQMAQQQHQKKQ